MSTQTLESVDLIGIFARTTNEDGKAMQDIPALWNQFMSQQLADAIPNKEGSEIYCVYTEYEGDHMKPYTVLLGCRVSSLETIPEGMKGMTINAGPYATFKASGNLMEGAVANAWYSIWETELDRNYAADFEVYGEKAQNPADAEVDIFVGLNA